MMELTNGSTNFKNQTIIKKNQCNHHQKLKKLELQKLLNFFIRNHGSHKNKHITLLAQFIPTPYCFSSSNNIDKPINWYQTKYSKNMFKNSDVSRTQIIMKLRSWLGSIGRIMFTIWEPSEIVIYDNCSNKRFPKPRWRCHQCV